MFADGLDGFGPEKTRLDVWLLRFGVVWLAVVVVLVVANQAFGVFRLTMTAGFDALTSGGAGVPPPPLRRPCSCWPSFSSHWHSLPSSSPLSFQGGLLSGAAMCQTLHGSGVCRQNHQHQKAVGQRWGVAAGVGCSDVFSEVSEAPLAYLSAC